MIDGVTNIMQNPDIAKVNAHNIAALLLDIHAVTLNVTKPFRYTSGILSPIYCDNRLIISYPEKRERIIHAFLTQIQSHNLKFDVVAGTATAGIPHAAWIADRLKKPMVYVRSAPKTHGKKNQIEGKIQPGQVALVVEDLISTGGSAINAVYALRENSAIVHDCLAIFTYEMKNAQDAFKKAQVQCHTLCNFSTLIDVATKNGQLSKEERIKALQWNLDPEHWS